MACMAELHACHLDHFGKPTPDLDLGGRYEVYEGQVNSEGFRTGNLS